MGTRTTGHLAVWGALAACFVWACGAAQDASQTLSETETGGPVAPLEGVVSEDEAPADDLDLIPTKIESRAPEVALESPHAQDETPGGDDSNRPLFLYASDWSPDGRELSLGGSKDAIVVVDMVRGRLRKVLTPYAGDRSEILCIDDLFFTDVLYSPSGKTIAALRGITSFGVFFFQSSSLGLRRSLEGMPVDRMQWSRDATRLFLHSDFIGGDVVQSRTGKVLFSAERRDHGEGVEIGLEGRRAAMSSDSKLVAMTEVYDFTRLFDAQQKRQLAKLPHAFPVGDDMETCFGWTDIEFSPDDRYLSLLCSQLLVWDVSTQKLISPTKATLESRVDADGEGRHYDAHAWSPDGTKVALAGQDDGLAIWNLASNRDELVFNVREDEESLGNRVSDVEWHPNGRFVSWVQGTRLWVLRIADGAVFFLEVHPDPGSGSWTLRFSGVSDAESGPELSPADVTRFMTSAGRS
jgi:WD40 repeat protein